MSVTELISVSASMSPSFQSLPEGFFLSGGGTENLSEALVVSGVVKSNSTIVYRHEAKLLCKSRRSL